MTGIEVFRSGEWIDNAGRKRTFTAEQVKEIARRYNAQQYPQLRAPATLGHPTGHGPAYGYARRMYSQRANDGAEVLLADFEQINVPFFEAVKAGQYSARSLCVDPDTLMVYHIAWLGDTLPAVPGLKPAAFARASPSGARSFSQPVPATSKKWGPLGPPTAAELAEFRAHQARQKAIADGTLLHDTLIASRIADRRKEEQRLARMAELKAKQRRGW